MLDETEQSRSQEEQEMTGYSRVYESAQFNAAYGSAMQGKCLMRKERAGLTDQKSRTTRSVPEKY